MIVDGKQIAKEIEEELQKEVSLIEGTPSLFVLVVGEDPVTRRFVQKKEKFAKAIGVSFVEEHFSEDVSEEKLLSVLEKAIEEHDGIVVQLPLPGHIDTQRVLDTVPETHDVDVLSLDAQKSFEEGKLSIFPAVVGACKEILVRHDVLVTDKKVTVVGKGNLVGKPAAAWFEREGAQVTVVGRGESIEEETESANIVLLGAGSPGILTKNMVNEHTVVLDAGTSEASGALQGDADPTVGEKVALFTPVPGGIGPITVAVLFKNLVTLALLRRGDK